MYIKSWIRNLVIQNYTLAKALWKRNQYQEMMDYPGPPILNYQMGNVGSSTVQASLDALNLNKPIYYIHFRNPKRVREIERQRRAYLNTNNHGLLLRPWLYEFLYEQIQKKDRNWNLSL